ncbi:cysteine-rich repeat secretory protein 38-like [Salvia hispanica]|uniref:cysteine-rich repeat secretory protein 38-like n=1 Tax=Salvia hispanica TaxID=49212 RepID=UPI002009A48D|nr:cysteine-rich repeat secretory protein 38-like [Salvia hispanica]
MWEIPNLIILLLLLLLPLHISVATSQPICGVSGETFANNSSYEANLNTLIASLSSGGIGSRRFLNTSVGNSPDTVNAVVVCRGNISLPSCRKCVAAAAPATAQRCPNWKEAVFWNETCTFKYSHKPISGVLNIQSFPHLPSKKILLESFSRFATIPCAGNSTANGTGDGTTSKSGVDSPADTVPSTKGTSVDTTRIIDSVISSVGATVLLVVVGVLFKRRKEKQKAKTNFEIKNEVNVGSVSTR